MNNVLIIAHDFPPIASSGSFRPAKFVKYLPDWGWQPYVLATDRVPGLTDDPILMKDIPPTVDVWRVPSAHLTPLDRLESVMRRSLRHEKGTSLLRRLAVAPFSVIQDPPVDKEIYWALRLIPLALRIIREKKIDVIFTTSPPWSALLTGLMLRALTGLPWVADMRDPWTTEEVRYTMPGWRRAVDSRLERFCLSRANAIIGVNEKWAADLSRIIGENGQGSRVRVITNGHDLDDFAQLGSRSAEKACARLQLVHFGSLYEGGLVPLLNALGCMDPRVMERLCFDLVGYVHPNDLLSLQASPAGHLFSHHPTRISHHEALARMHSADVLLLLLSFDYYPGKIFEYMRVGRPVLALAPNGIAAQLVRTSGIGHVVENTDAGNVAAVLEEIALDYQTFVSRHYHPDLSVIKQFDRRQLAGKLAEILKEELVHHL